MKFQEYHYVLLHAIPPSLWKSCGWTVHFLWSEWRRENIWGGDIRSFTPIVAVREVSSPASLDCRECLRTIGDVLANIQTLSIQ